MLCWLYMGLFVVLCWQCDVFWLLFFFATGLYIWFWFYYWLLAENSMEIINGSDRFCEIKCVWVVVQKQQSVHKHWQECNEKLSVWLPHTRITYTYMHVHIWCFVSMQSSKFAEHSLLAIAEHYSLYLQCLFQAANLKVCSFWS